MCVGHAIITALDTPDEARPRERRKVFMLSIKVVEAVDEKKVATLTEDDIAHLAASRSRQVAAAQPPHLRSARGQVTKAKEGRGFVVTGNT